MDPLQSALDALSQYQGKNSERCLLVEDTPSEWMIVGTGAAYVALAQAILAFVHASCASTWAGTDLETEEIGGIKAIGTNTIKQHFQEIGDALPVAAYLCLDEESVKVICRHIHSLGRAT